MQTHTGILDQVAIRTTDHAMLLRLIPRSLLQCMSETGYQT